MKNLTPVPLLSQSHYKPAVTTVQRPKPLSFQGNSLQLNPWVLAMAVPFTSQIHY
ncbi:hypothetical protein [Nostoc sp.]|uniref:hypothetical protein n=1 Tax=Nostoc sp. TaxID=1180 RepID=UPI002FFA608C